MIYNAQLIFNKNDKLELFPTANEHNGNENIRALQRKKALLFYVLAAWIQIFSSRCLPDGVRVRALMNDCTMPLPKTPSNLAPNPAAERYGIA